MRRDEGAKIVTRIGGECARDGTTRAMTDDARDARDDAQERGVSRCVDDGIRGAARIGADAARLLGIDGEATRERAVSGDEGRGREDRDAGEVRV